MYVAAGGSTGGTPPETQPLQGPGVYPGTDVTTTVVGQLWHGWTVNVCGCSVVPDCDVYMGQYQFL